MDQKDILKQYIDNSITQTSADDIENKTASKDIFHTYLQPKMKQMVADMLKPQPSDEGTN